MIDDVEELYDYDALRQLSEPTMLVVRVATPVVVLGSTQPREALIDDLGDVGLRRRRGGGGAVLLRPDDVWVDWWIPSSDPRWSVDILSSSFLVGGWWEYALRSSGVSGDMHRDRVVDDPRFRVACFSGRGPGEIFVDDRKAVGLTQWRVREGAFVSTVLPEHDSTALVGLLRDPDPALRTELTHHGLASLDLDADVVTFFLRSASEPAAVRELYLLA